ncbi:MAG: alcohol dehydrogenase family protein, partial [Gammaproteobacteria bacterium]
MTVPTHMRAVRITGHGGLDKLEYREDVAVPEPAADEVLIEVGACGLNNTDVNTRTAWYSKSVREATDAGGATGFEAASSDDSTWGGARIVFPRIQGADVAGTIVGVGADVPAARMGERVLVDPWMRDARDPGNRNLAGYFGSERDGGYAEYTAVPAVNAFPIRSQYSNAELATFPCSYSTGENMLTRARLSSDETILITGASGGVGSALVQLAKRRAARVIAIAGSNKMEAIAELGADCVIPRDAEDFEAMVRAAAPDGEVQVVADVVGGRGFPRLLELLARGGRYVAAGAIAGPTVDLDLRTLYLKDLELLGATVMPVGIFETLVGYIEREEIRPLLAKTFPLHRLRDAQNEFLHKQ